MYQQSNLKKETRYGLPTADQILFNRHYVVGYSYYFRQAAWALEIIDGDIKEVKRLDNFRPDYRVPECSWIRLQIGEIIPCFFRVRDRKGTD